MARLGQLERTVMETLWDLAAADPAATFTVRDVAPTLPDHAYTTIHTVLHRLAGKGFVVRIRDGKTHHYRPTGTRESYVTELMQEALATTSDSDAALVHFVKTVPPNQARILREVLSRLEGGSRDKPTP